MAASAEAIRLSMTDEECTAREAEGVGDGSGQLSEGRGKDNAEAQRALRFAEKNEECPPHPGRDA